MTSDGAVAVVTTNGDVAVVTSDDAVAVVTSDDDVAVVVTPAVGCCRLSWTGTWLRTSLASSTPTTTCSRGRSCASSRSTSSAPPLSATWSGASSTPSSAPGT